MGYREERRQFTRVAVAIDTTVEAGGDGETTLISGQTKNLSLKGIYLYCPETLPPGTDCRVSLVLADGPSQPRVEAYGRVARVDDDGMGIEFVELLGLESLDHLRKMVLYNSSEDAERVEEEFRRHLGLKPRP